VITGELISKVWRRGTLGKEGMGLTESEKKGELFCPQKHWFGDPVQEKVVRRGDNPPGKRRWVGHDQRITTTKGPKIVPKRFASKKSGWIVVLSVGGRRAEGARRLLGVTVNEIGKEGTGANKRARTSSQE